MTRKEIKKLVSQMLVAAAKQDKMDQQIAPLKKQIADATIVLDAARKFYHKQMETLGDVQSVGAAGQEIISMLPKFRALMGELEAARSPTPRKRGHRKKP